MKRYSTLSDVVNALRIAFGDYADQYDLEAIARETHEYRVDLDERGRHRLDTAGFEQSVTDEEFWRVVARHEINA